jgi:EpsI family protein
METTMTQVDSAAKARKVALWIALASALILMFSHVISRMWFAWFQAWQRMDLSLYHRFTDGDSYYTHGPLILLVSAGAMLFMIRRVKIAVKPDVLWGNLTILAAILFYLFGCVVGSTVINGIAWIALLGAIVLRFWGRQALGKLWFPIAFLFFMIPLPMWIIADVNLALKLAATEWGVRLANFMGIMTEQLGANILLASDKQPMTVADVCSGLRTLISLLAFGAAYTYVCRLPEIPSLAWRNIRPRLSSSALTALTFCAMLALVVCVLPVSLKWRFLSLLPLVAGLVVACFGQGAWRVGLFAATIPVALVANTLRITSIIVVAEFWGVKTATGAYHEDSGPVVFALAFLMMFALEKLVLAAHRWAGRPMTIAPLLADLLPKGDKSHRNLFLRTGAWPLLVLALVGLLCGSAAWWLDREPPPMRIQKQAASALPPQFTVGQTQLSSSDMTLDENTLLMLNTRDYLYRQYSGLDRPVDICIVFSKDNPASSHPPELCLTAGGGNITDSRDVTLDGIHGMKDVACRELVVQQHGGVSYYYIYTFKYGQGYTQRFAWQQVWLFFKSRLFGGGASGALIRISTPISTDIDDARQRAMNFMRASLPYLDQGLK